MQLPVDDENGYGKPKKETSVGAELGINIRTFKETHRSVKKRKLTLAWPNHDGDKKTLMRDAISRFIRRTASQDPLCAEIKTCWSGSVNQCELCRTNP